MIEKCLRCGIPARPQSLFCSRDCAESWTDSQIRVIHPIVSDGAY